MDDREDSFISLYDRVEHGPPIIIPRLAPGLKDKKHHTHKTTAQHYGAQFAPLSWSRADYSWKSSYQDEKMKYVSVAGKIEQPLYNESDVVFAGALYIVHPVVQALNLIYPKATFTVMSDYDLSHYFVDVMLAYIDSSGESKLFALLESKRHGSIDVEEWLDAMDNRPNQPIPPQRKRQRRHPQGSTPPSRNRSLFGSNSSKIINQLTGMRNSSVYPVSMLA
ncbi:hypothetical protein EJ05DRAFT_480798 [Pseudovirgaria hyperparasitica]|uniref:Uncharacterized protein n=1 Tax=Pseudovirgaria hyperparasitica TaxID=470096 RepID=A0A6A6VRY0_9PEZI|nr:uncharacterized protein EJ05DRAFT_480798 [Pseudovirgaria hyperparasitica]KAF2752953.1 hypothetical protein EJ05DRAFT_480798 [Pseudovirgaria hyperparasitica]